MLMIENVNDYLTIIKANLRTSAKKVDDNIKNQYTVPIGETLVSLLTMKSYKTFNFSKKC